MLHQQPPSIAPLLFASQSLRPITFLNIYHLRIITRSTTIQQIYRTLMHFINLFFYSKFKVIEEATEHIHIITHTHTYIHTHAYTRTRTHTHIHTHANVVFRSGNKMSSFGFFNRTGERTLCERFVLFDKQLSENHKSTDCAVFIDRIAITRRRAADVGLTLNRT